MHIPQTYVTYMPFFRPSMWLVHLEVMDIDAVGTFNTTRAAFDALKTSQFGGVVCLGPGKKFGGIPRNSLRWGQVP